MAFGASLTVRSLAVWQAPRRSMHFPSPASVFAISPAALRGLLECASRAAPGSASRSRPHLIGSNRGRRDDLPAKAPFPCSRS
jgi:hypothetical protein